MGLIAAIAVAIAACCAAAINGLEVEGFTVPVHVYGLCLVPGIAAVAVRRNRPPRPLPEWSLTISGRGVDLTPAHVIVPVAIIAVAVGVQGASVQAFATILLLGVAPLGLLWPRPGALGAALLQVALSILGGPSLADQPGLIAGVAGASVVALAAITRLSHDLAPGIGRPAEGGRRRVLAAATAIFAAAMLAGLVLNQLLPPPSSSAAGGEGRPEEASGGGDKVGTEVIAFRDELDVTADEEPPSHAVVLRVQAPGPEVWRTQTFDEWDGRRWRPSDELGEMVAVDDLLGEALAPYAGGPPFAQRFTVEARAMDTLAVAPEPWSVSTAYSTLEVNQLGTIRPIPGLGAGERYVVRSQRRQSTDEALRAGDPSGTGLELESYGRLPATSDRVRSLTVEITAAAPTSFDKAQAVERWLEANIRMVRAGAPLPVGADPVEMLLFVDRSATPQRLATAMAVMLRTVGVPTRLAIGFLPGRRGLLDDEFTVRADDAHTWVEVPFPPYGWQRFDPSGLTEEAERADSFWARLLRLLRRLAPVLVAGAVVVLGLVLWRVLARRRSRRAQPWAVRYWEALLKAGARLGRPRGLSETPAEYTEALAGTALPDERLRGVGTLLTAATFSGREPPAESRSWADGVLRDAVVAGRRANRRRRFRRVQEPAAR